MRITRRAVLQAGLVGGALSATPLARAVGVVPTYADRMAESALPAPFTMPFRRPPVIKPVRSDATTDYFHVSMVPTTAEIITGFRTPVWAYQGQVPGPTFQVSQGREVVVRHVNKLPATHPTLGYAPWTSVHLHGQASLPPYDGYASDVTNPGQYKDYHYPNWQRARTLWYHDHGLHHTAENVYMGLAGAYLLRDPAERALPLPNGAYDVPLIVSDRMFTSGGGLLFDTNDHTGLFGDVVTVNGRAWPVMRVQRRKYRFRILNASVTRSYAWWLSDGSPMTVVGTDAGLMATPQQVSTFRHAPAERYEVVIDFAQHAPGDRVELRNDSPRNNVDFTHTDKVMAFEVTAERFPTSHNAVPSQLVTEPAAMAVPESAAVRTRAVDLARTNGQWTINGTTWDEVVRSGFTQVLADPTRDDVEIWELRNPHGGWHHPVHVHFVDFKILTRNGNPCEPHERGAKDVVYLGEDETVRVLIKFDRGAGKYMVHCHNLVHEDHDMMSQFVIQDTEPALDPLSRPCSWLPEGDL